jgi:hypothetical protein
MGIMASLRKVFSGGDAVAVGHPGSGDYASMEYYSRDDAPWRPGLSTYRRLVHDVTVVATGVRAFLDLAAAAHWEFAAAEADPDGKYAELAQQALTSDPATSWAYVVKRAVMYRFYGFSLQEWTARRREDGVVTFADVAPRPQETVSRWETRADGYLVGAWQQVPRGEVLIPRERLLYLADATLTSHPAGTGLLRHAVREAERLDKYKRLEAHGFEADLRGVPVARAPLTLLREAETAGSLTPEERAAALRPVREFLKHSLRGPRLGVLLDSATYASRDDAAKPSSVPHWNLDVVRGGSSSQPEVAAAVRRSTLELAQLLGIEQFLLGDKSGGSFALSADKSAALHLQVNSVLREVADAVSGDLVWRLWQLNGWPEAAMPVVAVEQVKHRDVSVVAKALKDLAAAKLAPDDRAVRDVRSLLGVSPPPAFDTSAAVGSLTRAEGSESGPSDETRQR